MNFCSSEQNGHSIRRLILDPLGFVSRRSFAQDKFHSVLKGRRCRFDVVDEVVTGNAKLELPAKDYRKAAIIRVITTSSDIVKYNQAYDYVHISVHSS